MGGLIDLVDAWFAGRPTENLELFGVAMVLWGRLGKSMLYLAGLTVVLDLPDPKKLQNHGAAATERARWKYGRMGRKRQVRRLLGIQEAALNHIAYAGPRRGLTLVTRLPAYVPAGLQLELAQYRDFRNAVVAALPTEHACRYWHGHSVCPQQIHYAISRINSLIAEQLPEDERDLIREMEATRTSEFPMIFILGIPLIGFSAVGIERVREAPWAPWAFGSIVLIYLACLIVLLPESRLVMAAAGYRAWGWGLSRYGRLLNQTRPLHLLRWVAAVLFAIGGLLDLLAS
ncbi:hypothetical protein ACFYL6_14230 [Micromonospora sp. NPDC007208]|uniref:hypothetical protein n=1 Tax=Micromonospora sp. NPDC007208 TaxID=3364236 RepID=UPI003682DC7A